MCRERRTGCRRLHRRQDRDGNSPRDHETRQHRHPDRQPYEMPCANERERPREVVPARRRRPDTEETRELSAGETRCRYNGEPRRRDGAEDHRDESFSRFARLVLRFAARTRSNLEHLGRRDAFGVGKVGGRYQSASQRDREQHAKHAPAQADEKRLPERESRPPSDDHESRQNEDDR